jgi:hypothetical protein
MAWPTPDLEDLILTEDNGGKKWLHALCLAVNERQNGLGLTRTQFNKGSGGTGTFLDIDDFTGLWIGGESDGAITNLNLCMTAIKAMLSQTTIYGTTGSWLQATGLGATAWSLSSLESDIGLGTFPNACDSWTDLNFWKQIHGALDRMTICRKISLAGAAQISERASSSGSVELDGDEDALWAEAVADSSATVTDNVDAGWFLEGFRTGPFDANYNIQLRNEGRCSFANSCSGLGTLDEAYYYILQLATSEEPDWEVGATGETPITVAANFNGHLASSDLSLASSNTTEYRYTASDASLPGSSPTTVGGGPPSYGAFAGWWASMKPIYADLYITPYLTDQT